MNARLGAGLLWLAAALVYGAGALPIRNGADAEREEFRRARDERKRAEARLAPLERRAAARVRASAILEAAPSGTGEPTMRLHRSVVALFEGMPVSNPRLTVRPGRAPAGASVHVSVDGSFPAVSRFAGALVAPGTGLVLDRVQFAAHGSQVSVEVDALFPRGARP